MISSKEELTCSSLFWAVPLQVQVQYTKTDGFDLVKEDLSAEGKESTALNNISLWPWLNGFHLCVSQLAWASVTTFLLKSFLLFSLLPTHVLSYCSRVSSSCFGLSAKDWWQLEGEQRGMGFSQICRSLDSLVDKLVLLTASSVYSLMLTPAGLKVAEGKEESPLLVAASYIGLNWQCNHILRAWQRLKSLSYL